ncbi:MAG: peripheral protein, partial [Lachnospiraceae bacterium]
MEKKIPKSVLAVMFVSVLSVCQTVSANELAKKEQWEYASTTPDGKYPELVTYTLGKMTGANNSNLPKGETYENNAYTRYLREYFNIQNKDVFEEKNDQYNVSVSVAMSSDNLPDLMLVGSIEDLRQLVALDLIEDLTKSYENCLTDRIKDIYASYGEGIIDGVTFDGKIMAIPETNIDDGPNLLWLRRDWMDKLGLESPKTIEDAEAIVQAFIEKDPGENGEGKTVGFVCDPELSGECGYSSEYLMDIVFAANGAYPKQWIEDENGEVSYGSVLPQAKDALAKLKSMYERNILDQNFLLRTSVNNIELITKGLCGSFFGPWWAANNPLMEAIAANPDAVWEPFLIQTDDDGSTSYYSQNPTYKYVVVRKGYEHPEIACKIINGLFDYVRYDGTYNSEFEEYYQNNVDPTARPLAINVDYS